MNYTIAEAADITDIPIPTIRYWYRTGRVIPSKTFQHGGLTVYLWTPNDIRLLKAYRRRQQHKRKKHP